MATDKKKSPNEPKDSHRKDLTPIIVAIIGVVGTIVAAYFAFKSNTVPTEIAISATQTAKSINTESVLNTTDFPFVPIKYDFESPTDIAPWQLDAKSLNSLISQDFSHSDKHSLMLLVDLHTNSEYAGIRFTNADLLEVKAITAWVFVPYSEASQNNIFTAQINVNFYSENITFGLLGEEKTIKLGTWTPLYIGTFGETDNPANNFAWNGKVDELYLHLWSDEPYMGPVFIDDIFIYK